MLTISDRAWESPGEPAGQQTVPTTCQVLGPNMKQPPCPVPTAGAQAPAGPRPPMGFGSHVAEERGRSWHLG